MTLPLLLLLGVAVGIGAVQLRGPLGGLVTGGGTAAVDQAAVLDVPRPATDRRTQLPALSPKPAPTTATKTPTAKPSPTARKRASRSKARTTLPKHCPVVHAKATSYPNGNVPASGLCALPQAGERLYASAAEAFWRMNAAYKSAFGKPMCVSSSYRSLADQEKLHDAKPELTAKPGSSNHGWGLAVDLCAGVDKVGTPQHRWMDTHAARYQFENPSWAQPGGSKPEPWHWEYTADSGRIT